MRRPRGDDGSALVELVLFAMVFFAFAAAVNYVGRLNVASSRVEAVARTTARTISMARDPHAARGPAMADAASQLALGTSPMCRTWDFPLPSIEAERVTVTITCQVDISAAALLEVPGEHPVSSTAVEVIDRYRERP